MSRVRAFLFDLDGTLIDSMPHHHDAWVAWYARRGLAMEPGGFFASTAGRSNAEILADMFPELSLEQHAAMADEKEALYRQLAARSLRLVEGVQAFLDSARAQGIAMAVCTASTPQNIALAFEMHGIDKWVDTVVSPADRASGPSLGTERPQGRSVSGLSPTDGLRGKPHPDLFVEAARRLGVAPAQCLVFEDAPLGVEAARRAGMAAVALTTTLPAQDFSTFPNVIAVHADFSALAPDNLPALTKEEHHA